MAAAQPRWLFVTGKLAESALRRQLAELAPKVGFDYQVVTLNITVAALMTTEWIARHLPKNISGDTIFLPGLCQGSAEVVTAATGIPTRHGPPDLRQLPEFFGQKGATRPADYGQFDIEIIAEINYISRKTWQDILTEAQRYKSEGADIIDLGCEPGTVCSQLADITRQLRDAGFRLSIDSLNPHEIEAALAAGAELVLSINSSNIHHVPRWRDLFADFEVVAIPDTPEDLDSLYRTADQLLNWGVRVRLDPLLEPIGFGFAASLRRYWEVRQRYPDVPMLMGVGNVTELTDVDSAGLNVLLAAFCQELNIQSILTTAVANWTRSSVKEWDLARKLVHYAIRHQIPPKRLEPDLILLRDPKLYEMGDPAIAELASKITDRNYRIIAERGTIYVFNSEVCIRGTDPFEICRQLLAADRRITPSHAFYLGYELAKAEIALTLHKNYTQDQPLRWGFLT
ncbi:MAG: DUF6513 domain-containing protein, partial [Gemmataceae bacterium]|nr:DUF6513 domain-containing protein [Gemmataceae bacterium]